MKIFKGSRIALISAITIGGFTQVEAMPMFATQTGMDCAGCHTQQMPILHIFYNICSLFLIV